MTSRNAHRENVEFKIYILWFQVSSRSTWNTTSGYLLSSVFWCSSTHMPSLYAVTFTRIYPFISHTQWHAGFLGQCLFETNHNSLTHVASDLYLLSYDFGRRCCLCCRYVLQFFQKCDSCLPFMASNCESVY